MMVNVISWKLSASQNPAQRDIQAISGELLMVKGVFNMVFLSTLYSIMQDNVLLLSGHQPRALPWRSTYGPSLETRSNDCLKMSFALSHSSNTSLPVSPSPPPSVYATTASIPCISASLGFANRFVCQSNILCWYHFQLRIVTRHVLSGLIVSAGFQAQL